jgi:DNA invertase Pin-like site-specific DNA recombinase
MCDIVQGFVDEGREKEREELIKKMLDANLVTPEQIANLLKISVAEVKKIAKKVPVEA